MEKIYCIGDSHVCFFSGTDKIQPVWPKKASDKIPIFRTHRIGATLANSLSHYGSRTKGREILFTLLDRYDEQHIPKGSKVLMCFGEIDCRAHLLKIAKKENRDVESVVLEAVTKYHRVLTEIQELGYQVHVWNAIPSGFKEEIPSDDFPTFGSSHERNHVTRLYNSLLYELCKNSNKPFISILDSLLNKENETTRDLYMDDIHLSQKAMPLAIKEFKKHNIDITLKNNFLGAFLTGKND